jgi:PAS domain S-box-containing protein
MKIIESKNIGEKKFRFPLMLFFIMILLACGLSYVWYYFVWIDEETAINNKKNELLSIADFKLKQIVSWRKERYADAEVIRNNPSLKKELNVFQGNKITKESRADIEFLLKTIKEMYDYDNICYSDAKGDIRICINPNYLMCSSVKYLIDSAKRTRKTLFSDFYRDSFSEIRLSLVIPLFITNQKIDMFIGSVILEIDPQKFIYPLIQQWPTNSRTSESYLLKRDNDSVIFLNELRHRKNTALNWKISMSDTNVLAVKAVLRSDGIYENIDYRNTKVIGAVRRIPNSSWFVIAKTDWEEIYSPLRERKVISIILVFSFMAVIGITFRLFWVRQRASYYRKNYEFVLEKQTMMQTLQGIIESTDDVIFSLDSKYCYTTFNKNHATMMKNIYNADIKISNSLLDYITPTEDKIKAKKNIDLALSGINVVEESYSGDVLFKRLYFEIIHHPINDSDGKVVGVSVFVKNITERKKAEELLLLKNLVFDSSIAANSISDLNGNITQINKSFLRIWGYSNVEEVIGNPISYFLMNFNEANEIINVLKQSGEWAGEFIAKKKDGSTFIAEALATTVKDLNNNIIGYQSSVMNITERRIAEEALQSSERELKAVQEIAHMGSWLWDVKTGFVKWSEETYKIFHLNPKEFTPQIDSILALSPWPGDHERGQELINRAIETHTPGFYEQRFLRPDNSIGYYISTFKGNYDENGSLVSIIGSVLDITERKKAEEALKESEEKFRNIFEFSAVGKSITSLDGKLITNIAYREILGYSEEELLNLKWREITHPDDVLRDLEILDSLLRKERSSARWKKRYIHKNGSIVWADISTVLQYDSKGDPLYFITSMNNITSEILALEELHRSRERFRRAMNNIPDVIVIYDKELKILYINESTSNITGHRIDDFIGKKDEEVFPPEVYQTYLPSLKEALKTRKVTSVDTEIMFIGFGKKSLHIICIPILDDKNEILEIIGITHDYTERKQAEDSIRERDQLLVYEQTKLETLLDISSGMYSANTFKDIGRTISNVLIRYRIGEAIGIKLAVYDLEEDTYEIVFLSNEDDKEFNKKFTNVNKPSSLKDVMYYSKIAIEQKNTLYIEDNYSEYSLSIDNRQKTLARSSMLFIPLFNRDVLIGLLSFARSPEKSMDHEFISFLENASKHASTAISKLLNEKKKEKVEKEIMLLNTNLEQRVIDRTAKLESANRDLESFSYSVSHDLRAPLRAINGFSQILVNRHKANLNEEGMHYLDNIIEASNRMSRLIEDILYYSRLGRKSISYTSVDLKYLLEKISSDYQFEIQNNNFEIFIPATLPIIESDKTLLNLILRNLIENGIKYQNKERPCKITIEYSEEGNNRFIKVKDNGIGINNEYSEKIFEVFQRLHNEDVYPGTGIGLAIVKKSAEMLKGTVYLEKSVINEGSTFTLKLPKE